MKIIKREKGFTLFELLVSISIIGILVALASVSYSAAQRKARNARRVQDMKAIQNAAEQYYSLSSYVYPTSRSGAWMTPSGQVVLENYPSDPKPDWTAYSSTTGTSSAYCICAQMEDGVGGNSSSNACVFSAGADDYYCIKNQQ